MGKGAWGARGLASVGGVGFVGGCLVLATAVGAQDGQGFGANPSGDMSRHISQDTSQQDTSQANGPSPERERFRVSVTPYAWLPSFSGEIAARGIEFDATTTFADIIDSSDSAFGLMGAIDFEVDRLVFQGNGAWVTAELGNARGVLRNGEVRSDLEFDAAWTEAFAGYRLLERSPGGDGGERARQRFTLDGLVGARVTFIDVDANVTAQTTVTLRDGTVLMPGQRRDQSQSEEWIEPFVGLRLGHDFGNGWSATVRADVGGFGVDGSEFSWQVEALGGYRWQLDGWNIALFGGYRALGQDYASGGFAWDMVTHGPVIGTQIGLRF